jgi:integrase
MTKRHNGEGTFTQRPNGLWQARLGYLDADNVRRRLSVYGATQEDARRKLAEARKRLNEGAPVRDARETVASWVDRWCETTLEASDRKATTKALYRTLAAKHLKADPLGSVRLDQLRPSHVEALVLKMRRAVKDGPDGEPVRALADSTIRTTYTVLRAVLDGAVRDDLLARNPAAVVKRPGVERIEAHTLKATEVVALLELCKRSRHYRAVALVAATGMRRGEALALRWRDVDLDGGTVTVRGTLARVEGSLVVTEPKTERSRRTLILSPGLTTLLREQRRTQLEDRVRAANVWREHGYVFTTDGGEPVDPRNLLRVVASAARRLGLEGVGVHTLRHSAADLALAGGSNIKTVSDMLGHSSVAITGDIYLHRSDEAQRVASHSISAAIGL